MIIKPRMLWTAHWAILVFLASEVAAGYLQSEEEGYVQEWLGLRNAMVTDSPVCQSQAQCCEVCKRHYFKVNHEIGKSNGCTVYTQRGFDLYTECSQTANGFTDRRACKNACPKKNTPLWCETTGQQSTDFIRCLRWYREGELCCKCPDKQCAVKDLISYASKNDCKRDRPTPQTVVPDRPPIPFP